MTSVALTGRRRLSAGEVEMILGAHEKFATGRPGGRRAVLKFVDLSGFNLVGRNLTEADFSGSILDGTRLAGANLERANLFGADLRNADLRGAR